MQTITDARSLSSDAQEALRLRVVDAVERGMRKAEAARTFHVSREAIRRWLAKNAIGGKRALRARKRGRPKAKGKLQPWHAAQTVRAIVGRCPDQLQLPFVLWTRGAVGALIERKWNVSLSVWTVGRMLRRWGLTPQKPLRRAYERNPAAVKRWLGEEYPEIRKRARREAAEIHWGDEMGVRSDHQSGTSYGRRGKTPAILGTGKRFRCNMLSTITNRGTLRFMLYRERFTAPVFLRFLRRLIKSSKRKVFLIIDRHPVHRDAKVERWIRQHRGNIVIFFLPGYSPDLNPDEFLNHDVKANAIGRKRPKTLPELLHNLRSILKLRQCNPEMVRRYFHAPTVRYAA
jgi:transposase